MLVLADDEIDVPGMGDHAMKHSSRGYPGYLGAILFALLSACGSPKQGTLPAELTQRLQTAVNAGDLAGCTAMFTDDAEVLEEHAPVVRGAQAVREYCAEQIHPDLALDITTTMSIVSEDLGVEQGTYRVRNVKIGANVEYGEYLNFWKRNGGQWKIFRSMLNATEAPARHISVSDAEEEAPVK